MRAAIPQVHDFLHRSAARRPEHLALVCGSARASHGEIEQRSDALAHTLEALGVERGDRVVVFADNGVESVVAFWAVLKANGIVCIVNALTKADKLAYLLGDCSPKVLITEARLAKVVAASLPRTADAIHVVLVGDAPQAALPNATRWDDALVARAPGSPVRRCVDVDPAAIIYTSGSTGEPKGVVLTHRNLVSTATSIASYLENTESDVILSGLPLAFTYGLYQIVTAALVGARVVLERSFMFITEILQRLVDEQVTGFPGVPTVFAMLAELENLAAFDLSKLRYVTNAAAALPDKHVALLQARLPHAKIFSMYGMTECGRTSYLPPQDLARKPGSVGIALPSTELWIVDEHDQRVGPGVVGQLVVRGPTVMRGYWNKPEATRERLRPGPHADEWVLYTGDSCKLDEDGYLYVVGRMDDIFKSRGEKVAPQEVERVLMNLRGVKEAAVIGVPDALLGHTVKAFVVLDDGASLTPGVLTRECKARLESFMVPKWVVIVAELPKTSSGKIKKTELR